MVTEEHIPLLENILGEWKIEIGDDFTGYRNHVYRMVNFCFAQHDFSDEERIKIIIAGCFHDLGIWSDRTGNRRGLAVIATFVQAASGVAIALVPTFEMTMVAAALMGVGYGAFSTVGLAFAADLLPTERDHARDLGIVNVTAALGQLIGPVLGAGLVALVGGFWLVFVAAAVLSVVGGLLTAMARQPTRQPQPS